VGGGKEQADESVLGQNGRVGLKSPTKMFPIDKPQWALCSPGSGQDSNTAETRPGLLGEGPSSLSPSNRHSRLPPKPGPPPVWPPSEPLRSCLGVGRVPPALHLSPGSVVSGQGSRLWQLLLPVSWDASCPGHPCCEEAKQPLRGHPEPPSRKSPAEVPAGSQHQLPQLWVTDASSCQMSRPAW
jgi:hypothetical protein